MVSSVISGARSGTRALPPRLEEQVANGFAPIGNDIGAAGGGVDDIIKIAFAEQDVAGGRTRVGLFPAAGEEAKPDFEAWKKTRADARA